MRMIGKKVNSWKVLEKGPKVKYRNTWLCECVCGKQKNVDNYSLISGRTTSCGCLRDKSNGERLLKHGMSKTRLYRIWHSMLGRCGYTTKQHPRYSGRGIKVEARWSKFENFYEDMSTSYYEHCKRFSEADTSIDRIDNDADYSKQNCRWATRKEQMCNTKNNKFISFNGKTKTISQWAEELGMPWTTLRRRLFGGGFTIEEALTLPVKKYKKYGQDGNRK